MNRRAEPRDEALAVFSQSHPGREREALRAALTWYQRTKGVPCTHPAAYFGGWDPADLASRFKLPPDPKRCPDCDGGGWIYIDPADPSTARKCEHPRKAAS